MAYQASAYNVMIASPGDVATERQLARDVIHEWNAIHSLDRKIILMPVGWDTHSSPDMDDRPQEIINKQVLENADLLIAVFWTRVGSPTGKAPSGTIEEIERHLAAGKPAMIYFSSAPVRPDSVDEAQYAALRRFKDECKRRGLIEEYESLSEFREKLTRHLAQTVIRRFSSGDSSATVPPRPPVPKLSNEGRELLAAAALDKAGQILRIQSTGGLTIQTNGKRFGEPRNPRSEALWEGAIEELRSCGLLQMQGTEGEVFTLTNKGYEVADSLRSQAA
jgi:hypothetical protein